MINGETLDNITAVAQWIIAPVAAFVWINYTKLQRHDTQIAVLQAEVSAAVMAHDREIKEIRDTSRAIMLKLDSIEEALRK